MPPSLASNTNSHSMASRLTRSSAHMGALELELETPDIPLDLPEDRLQEDASETTCAPGNSQPAATEVKILALETRVTQLEADLAVAHARIQDLTEINSFFRRTASNPAPPEPTKMRNLRLLPNPQLHR